MLYDEDRDVDLLYSSGDPDEEAELAEILSMPTDKNVSVVREGFLFNDVMGMPFLDTTDGKHIVGVEAIRGYLVTKD